jgi:hypothetical protein
MCFPAQGMAGSPIQETDNTQRLFECNGVKTTIDEAPALL